MLDKALPGWALKVPLAALRMDYVQCCILGHCYGNFWGALQTLRHYEDNDWAIHHGLNTPGSANAAQIDNGSYEYLAQQWRPFIRRRQGKVRHAQ